MARAMRASAEWNPNATRVSSRILVLVDSMSPLDRPWSSVALIVRRMAGDPVGRSTKAGMRQRRAQHSQRSSASFAGFAFDGEHVTQALFEQVGAVQAGVGLGDPVELRALVVGEVLGVLPQRVAGVVDRAGVTAGVPSPAACGSSVRGGARRSRPGGGPRRARRWPTRRRGTDPRTAPRAGSVRRRRWRSSRPDRPTRG